uniref:Uncharacterized protein n=1 Tax=Rhizophora mucronata TaxID=61149 RepID=A0A2P2NF34_RHIMU
MQKHTSWLRLMCFHSANKFYIPRLKSQGTQDE